MKMYIVDLLPYKLIIGNYMYIYVYLEDYNPTDSIDFRILNKFVYFYYNNWLYCNWQKNVHNLVSKFLKHYIFKPTF